MEPISPSHKILHHLQDESRVVSVLGGKEVQVCIVRVQGQQRLPMVTMSADGKINQATISHSSSVINSLNTASEMREPILLPLDERVWRLVPVHGLWAM
jgi:hypothetical protein